MKDVNFIPAELRPKAEIPGVLIPLSLLLVLLLNVMGAVTWNMLSTVNGRNELVRIETENAEIARKLEVLSGAKKRIKLDEAIESMKKILGKKNYWSGVFKEMSVLIPDGIWLTEFSNLKEGNGRPVNKAKPDEAMLLVKGEATSHEMIAQFLTGLEKSHYFAGVQMKSSEREENIRPSRFKFEFSIPVKAPTNEANDARL